MERQTKHRILGALVVIGLVIILLPLFQGEKDMTTEAALIKAPPFPNPSEQVAVNTAEPMPTNIPTNVNPLPTSAEPAATEMATTPASTPTPEQPTDMMQTARSSIVSEDVAAPLNAAPMEGVTTAAHATPDAVATPAAAPTQSAKTTYRILEGDKAAATLKKATRLSKNTYTTKPRALTAAKAPVNTALKKALSATPIEDDGLWKLKNAVWVIQLGSYNNKAKALQVVNQLRTNGYRAFIQQFPTSTGMNTQIYVGPENKPTHARALAARLEKEMHLQGMVISYKPLAL